MEQSADPTVEIARRSDMPGRLVSRYRLIEKLGSGARTAVYRACDDTTGRLVAFKQLLVAADDPQRGWHEALFQREYHTLIRLRHPRVIEVLDYGVGEAGPFYTMELLEGRDLQQLAPLPHAQVCALMRELASLLTWLQTQRLVHRDLSPRNVRILPNGRARLLDFGSLHGFGVSSERVGTASCSAPESVLGMPLDQRSDLFSLGALAYFALTGRHAYDASDVSELPALWQTPPAAPSRLAPDVPAQLDALVMAMLSVDPLRRPGGPAEMIERLSAFAGLPAESHALAADHHLRCAPLVGRELEQQWMEARVGQALAGQGSVALLLGPAGSGKTRLLHELALQAQLAGVVVSKADAEAHGAPFGVVTQLALGLLERCPTLACEAAKPHAALLAQLSPALRASLGARVSSTMPDAPGEQPARLRNALVAWFCEILRVQALGLVVDNLHAADEESAAVLAALGFAPGKLLVLATQRTGDAVVAHNPLFALRRQATLLELSALSPTACQQLVAALFGDVQNSAAAARLLHQHSAGNPQHVLELTRLLVRDRIATYAAGSWSLPPQLPEHALSARIDASVSGEFERLPIDARRMAEVLSIHDKPVPLDLCLAFSEAGPEQTHWALHELVSAQILISDQGQYRFAHQPLRQLLLAGLDEGVRRALHLRAADVLIELRPERIADQVEAGWQLVCGGDETRGADWIASAGRQFALGDAGAGSPGHMAQMLRVALDIYEREQRPAAELAGVLFPLLALAHASSDHRLILEYGERAIELGLRVTGLGFAETLRSRLGRRIALPLGLLRARAELRIRRRAPHDAGLRDLLVMFCGAVPRVLATLLLCNDVEAIDRIAQGLRALSAFGPDHLIALVHSLVVNQQRIAHGEFGEAAQDFERITVRLEDPRTRLALGEARWSLLQGSVLLMSAQLRAYGLGDAALRLSEQAAALMMASLSGAIDAQRLLYHAFRAEADQVQHHRERLERSALTMSSLWQVELGLPWSSFNADVLIGNTIAVRRSQQRLARHAELIPGVQIYADAALAGYLMLCGQLDQALAQYEALLPRLPPRQRAWWLTVRAQYARCLNWAGKYEHARHVLLETISRMSAADEMIAVGAIESRRQLALAAAGLGELDAARDALDLLLARHAGSDHPLLLGLLHKAAAEVALMARSELEFHDHLAAMRGHFWATKHPILIAQCERLAQQAERAGMGQNVRPPSLPPGLLREQGMGVHRALLEIAIAVEPFETALSLLVQRCHAEAGVLYRFDRERLERAAATAAETAPADLEARLRQLAERALRERAEADELDAHAAQTTSVAAGTTIVEPIGQTLRQGDHHAALLCTGGGQFAQVIGALILRGSGLATTRPSPALLQAVADALSIRIGPVF